MTRLRTSIFLVFTAAIVSGKASAHDTWVEVNSPEVREGNVVHVDLKLGNHGNDHRDFKMNSLITLDHVNLAVKMPCGCTNDIKPTLIPTASEPKQGYWTTRYTTTKPGLHVVSHELDILHGKIRAIKSAKTYFVVGPDPAATKGPLMKCDRAPGHPLELVPLTNPVTESGPNKPIRVRVVFEGKPLANARVTFIPRGQTLAEGFDDKFERRTDDKGVAEFTQTEANLILVVVHHQEPERSGEGYDSTNYSATLTVAVPEVSFPTPAATTTAAKWNEFPWVCFSRVSHLSPLSDAMVRLINVSAVEFLSFNLPAILLIPANEALTSSAGIRPSG